MDFHFHRAGRPVIDPFFTPAAMAKRMAATCPAYYYRFIVPYVMVIFTRLKN